MVAYNFKRRFIETILNGSKIHTIRAGRKRHAREGDALQLYYAQRTKQCRLLATETCFFSEPIEVDVLNDQLILFGNVYGTLRELNTFAGNDGFFDWDDLCEFWRAEEQECKFSGTLIAWQPFDRDTLIR